MKILMIIGQFYPTIGGAEQQCRLLSKALQKRGHTVKVVTVWQDRCLPALAVVEGISVERVWYPVFYLFGKRIGFGLLAPWPMFWRVYRSAKHYDVLHVHQALWPAFSSALAARLSHKPIVCKLGNSGERFDLWQLEKNHLYGRFARWFVKKYIDIFVWTSQAVYNDLKAEKILEKKLVYIPNGVELPDIGRLSLRSSGGSASIDGQTVHFIYTGTLTPKKNLTALVEAIHQLPEIYRGKLKLTILGDGPERRRLTQQIQTYKLDKVIFLSGSVENVVTYLEQSDVFILPSLTEGLSNSALEAMAYGLPVILSNQGGNIDLVKEDGILINPYDVNSLVKAIIYMIDHPSERRAMGKQSRIIVEQRYAIEKVTEKYEKLCQSLL